MSDMGPVAPPLMRPNEPGSDGQVVDQAQCHLDDFPDVGFVVDIQSRFELRTSIAVPLALGAKG